MSPAEPYLDQNGSAESTESDPSEPSHAVRTLVHDYIQSCGSASAAFETVVQTTAVLSLAGIKFTNPALFGGGDVRPMNAHLAFDGDVVTLIRMVMDPLLAKILYPEISNSPSSGYPWLMDFLAIYADYIVASRRDVLDQAADSIQERERDILDTFRDKKLNVILHTTEQKIFSRFSGYGYSREGAILVEESFMEMCGAHASAPYTSIFSSGRRQTIVPGPRDFARRTRVDDRLVGPVEMNVSVTGEVIYARATHEDPVAVISSFAHSNLGQAISGAIHPGVDADEVVLGGELSLPHINYFQMRFADDFPDVSDSEDDFVGPPDLDDHVDQVQGNPLLQMELSHVMLGTDVHREAIMNTTMRVSGVSLESGEFSTTTHSTVVSPLGRMNVPLRSGVDLLRYGPDFDVEYDDDVPDLLENDQNNDPSL